MTTLSRSIIQRAKRPETIIQFGGGNFLRAFADWAVQEMNEKLDFGAGVLVVKPTAREGRDTINLQEGLFTLYLTGIRNGQAFRSHQVVDCIQRQVNPYQDFQGFLEAAKSPELSIIFSNTTESGIVFDAECQLEDAPQSSFPGKLTRLLWERFQCYNGDPNKGVVVIPCELVENNGTLLKSFVLQHAAEWNLPQSFHIWLEKHNEFCNTLVDRIVPGFPKELAAEMMNDLGYEDELAVEGEQFHLWVIQGSEKAKRAFPAHEAGLNVIFTDDLESYRSRKVRILNGAHTSMVPVGYLAGLRTVREVMEDPQIGPFIRDFLYGEVVPHLPGDSQELTAYTADIVTRFLNPYLKHFLSSIALNSLAKYQTRVLPTLLQYVETRQSIAPHAAFSLAALIQFYAGTYGGEPTPVNDDETRVGWLQGLWGQVHEGKLTLSELTREVLKNQEIWGQNLDDLPGLSTLVGKFLTGIHTQGIRATLEDVL